MESIETKSVRRSDSINELAAALAKAQGLMEAAKKDSTNPHFKSKYADLAAYWDASRAALSSNGLAVVQFPTTEADGVGITTLLTHSSGQWMEGQYSLPIAQKTPQAIGSAITYGRRYAFAAVVGLAPDEDDDGNAASRPEVPAVAFAPARSQAPKAAQVAPSGEDAEKQAHVRTVLGQATTHAAFSAALDVVKDLVMELPDGMRAEIRAYATKRGAELKAVAQ